MQKPLALIVCFFSLAAHAGVNPSQEHTTAQSPSAVRLSNGSAWIAPTTPSDTQPVSGTVAATQSGIWTLALPSGASTETTLAALNAKVTAVNTGAVTLSGSLPAGTNNVGSFTLANASIAVTGPLTDAQLRATAVPVSGTFWPAIQPVSLSTLPALVAGSANIGSVTVANSSLAVTGAFFQATQPVSVASMPSTPVTGTFWQATQPVSLATAPALVASSANIGSVTLANASVAVTAAALPLPSGASTETTLSSLNGKVTAVNTGAVTISAALPAGAANIGSVTIAGTPAVAQSGTWTATPTTLTKGTQGAAGYTTQDLKDAGRTNVSITAEAFAGAAAEALITTTQSKAFATATTGTSYTVTAAKTLRLQSLTITLISTTTTANTSRIRLRVNPGGAAIITSPIVFTARVGWPTATFIANEAQTVNVQIPDGIEVPAGGGVALTHIEAAANGTVDVSLQGFEY